MIISGGMSYIVPDILEQFKEFGIDENKINKVLILHSHFDHVGIIPFFKRRNPQIEVCGSERAWEILRMDKAIVTINEFSWNVAKRMGKEEVYSKHDLEWRDDISGRTIREGDRNDLGGIEVLVFETPGHSSCCIAGYVLPPDAVQPGDVVLFSWQAGQELLLDELALLQKDLTTTLSARESREPVHLFLFQTRATYQAYLKQYFPKVPYRRALYMKARGPGMVFAWQGAEFEIDVRHESTHALLHAWLPSVPLWLDEGLAEYFEVPRDKRAGGNPHLEVVRAQVASGPLLSLAEMESLTDIGEMGVSEYREAWAWVNFLLHGPLKG